jgi:hypothetical protein
MLENVTDLSKLGHNTLARLVTTLRTEAQGGLATRLLTEIMRHPLRDAHAADAAWIELDHFDTLPSVGAGQIVGTVGQPDVALFATTGSKNEAGHIVVQRAQGWAVTAGNGGWQGWGIVEVSYSTKTDRSSYQPEYTATSGGGYGALDHFAIDLTGHGHKPLHGRTIDSGGGITVRLIVRPLGPPGSVVVWPGADLQAISPAACTLLQKMQVWAPPNYGPIHTRHLFAGGKESNAQTGRKATVSAVLGQARVAKLIASLSNLLEPPQRLT